MTGFRSSFLTRNRAMIRRAASEDRAAVEAIVAAAYAVYIGRIGKSPGPMLDDYRELIAGGSVSVAADLEGTIAGLIVLLAKPDHLLLDNVVVLPERQGQKIGRRLIAFAEDEARRLGYYGVAALYARTDDGEHCAVLPARFRRYRPRTRGRL